jgi:hypothetical protein
MINALQNSTYFMCNSEGYRLRAPTATRTLCKPNLQNNLDLDFSHETVNMKTLNIPSLEYNIAK